MGLAMDDPFDTSFDAAGVWSHLSQRYIAAEA